MARLPARQLLWLKGLWGVIRSFRNLQGFAGLHRVYRICRCAQLYNRLWGLWVLGFEVQCLGLGLWKLQGSCRVKGLGINKLGALSFGLRAPND